MAPRARLLIVSAALACACALAIPAGATKTASTEITLRVGDVSQAPLFGRVTSEDPACVQGRKVQVISMAPQRGTLGPADNPTNAKGKWKFTSQLDGATSFMARVKAKTVEGVRCESASSPVRSL